MAISFIGGENGVPGGKHRPVASHWQTLSYNVVSSTPRHERGFKFTTLDVIGTDCIDYPTTIQSRRRPPDIQNETVVVLFITDFTRLFVLTRRLKKKLVFHCQTIKKYSMVDIDCLQSNLF